MPIHLQDIIDLCEVVLKNEKVLINVGKIALNIALSPSKPILDAAKLFTGVVLKSYTEKSRNLAPTKHKSLRMSAHKFIKKQLDRGQKQRLAKKLGTLLHIEDDSSYSELLSLIMNNPAIKEELLKEIKQFLNDEKISYSNKEESDEDFEIISLDEC